MSKIRLTSFSHGAGCGCKISPKILETILGDRSNRETNGNLLVGNDTKDDAAVYDIGNNQAIISTTDFFMPIVDDPFDFGAIASANALSDVYAMGGKPLMAIAILGWPIDKIPIEAAAEVLEGSRKVCKEAGISLAGGHSIDCPEPIFGLAATGIVDKQHIKKNSTAKSGSHLFLTKPLGVGIITTAEKKGIAQEAHLKAAKSSMMTLNSVGSFFGVKSYINALTDVTGFGLLGHLKEICESSDLSAVIDFDSIPKFDFLDQYIDQSSIPGGTNRNWESYGNAVSSISPERRAILADPQTSGGLLVSVDSEAVDQFIEDSSNLGLSLEAFGKLTSKQEKIIIVD